MRHRADPIPPPFGHVEPPRPSREVSALVAADFRALDTPTITRRAAEEPMAGWADLEPGVRRSTRDYCAQQVAGRLKDAKNGLEWWVVRRLTPPFPLVERVAKLERSLAAVLRWP